MLYGAAFYPIYTTYHISGHYGLLFGLGRTSHSPSPDLGQILADITRNLEGSKRMRGEENKKSDRLSEEEAKYLTVSKGAHSINCSADGGSFAPSFD